MDLSTPAVGVRPQPLDDAGAPVGGGQSGASGWRERAPSTGPPASADDAMTRAYHELRAIAHARLVARARGLGGALARDDTLSTTALVHEAWLRVAGSARGAPTDRAHLLALGSLAMRHVLVDQARERAALKRGSAQRPVTLDDDAIGADDQPELVLQIDDALDRLAAVDARLAQVIECRFFGGLTEEETATALGVTVRTVQRDWVKARALLRRALGA